MATQAEEIRDLTTLNEQERHELRELLRNSRGTAQLWVHTHFQSGYKDLIEPHEYIKNLGQLVEKSSRKIPIIALVESPIDSDPERIEITRYAQHHARVNRSIYYVRTYQGDPTPSLDKDPLDPEKERENWDQFAKLLRELEVRKVIVSGENFFNAEHPENRGCVGYTLHQLERRAIISFQSKVTFPDTKIRRLP